MARPNVEHSAGSNIESILIKGSISRPITTHSPRSCTESIIINGSIRPKINREHLALSWLKLARGPVSMRRCQACGYIYWAQLLRPDFSMAGFLIARVHLMATISRPILTLHIQSKPHLLNATELLKLDHHLCRTFMRIFSTFDNTVQLSGNYQVM